MAVPVIASSTTDTTGGTANTTVSLSMPSGLSVGDLIVAIFADEQNNVNDCPALTSPDAYTRITHGDNSQDCQAAIYWRVCDGTETWPLVIAGTSGDYAVGWCLRITGADIDNPIHRTGSWYGVGSTGGTCVVPQVNTALANCLGLAIAAYDGSDIAPATVSGTGWTLQASLEDPSNNAGGAAADYATKSLTGTGDTVDCTFTMGGSDGRVGIQIAIVALLRLTWMRPALRFPVPTLKHHRAAERFTYLTLIHWLVVQTRLRLQEGLILGVIPALTLT
jgi:hypothetical protein